MSNATFNEKAMESSRIKLSVRSFRRWKRKPQEVLVAGACVLPAWVNAALPAAPSHCTPAEQIAFSCQTGATIMSLYAAGKGGKIDTLAYRYGKPGNVEYEYVASHDNGKHFLGAVTPAAPGASVRQVWFGQGPVTYLLTECVGGACLYSAGLSVLKGEKILSNKRCSRTSDDRAWFAAELVKFGSDLDSSRSNTGLLQLEESDNPVERIYRNTAGSER